MEIIDWIYFFKVFGVFVFITFIAIFGLDIRPSIIKLVKNKLDSARGKLIDKTDNLKQHIEHEYYEKDGPKNQWDNQTFFDFKKALEEINNEEYDDKEFQTLVRKVKRLDKTLDILTEWFTFEEFTWKSCWHYIIGGASYLVSVALSFNLLVSIVYCSIDETLRYNNWDSKVAYYEELENPTFKQCKEAEDENAEYKKAIFIKKEFLNSKQLIDTELLWAKFTRNIDTKKLILHD